MPKIRWLMIWLCFMANAIGYIDRSNIAVATPAIRAELGISPIMMGLVLSAFFWTYAFAQLPAGWFIDKVGVRVALTVAVGWWSMFTAATGLARSVTQFIAMRLMLGLGESASQPAFAKVAFNWFPRTERGLACSIFNSGSTAGTALSLPLVTWLILLVGWRGSFVVTGSLGIAWALAWWFIYRDPERWRAVAPEQVDRLLAQRAPPPSAEVEAISWFDLFRYRSVWGLMLGLFCLNFAIYFFITWFPSYLQQARGFSLAALGSWGAIPPLMGIPGNWLGGWTSDRLIRGGWSPTAARKSCLVGGMLMSSCIGLSAFVESTWVCLALFTLAFASLSFTGANMWTVVSEIAPSPRHVASIGGIQNCAGNMAGIILTTFTGVVLMLTKGSFLIPLAVAGAMCIVGAMSYLFLLGKVEPLPPLPAR
jgi:ACS family D-galactonate transporter-like MFS transporter